MQRMSGIATQTDLYVQKLRGTNAKVLDTRKTSPALRILEKEAVRLGGGTNHRMGLFDMMLIKDNHIDFAKGIKNAILAANLYKKENNLDVKIEIEARSFDEIQEILQVGNVDIIMIDNFTPLQTLEAVKLINQRFLTEASGGITLENIADYAHAGVDYISIGALTHQIKSLDLSLKAIDF
jgi:nicotinate-nucleotide pyrophosphorylase (carboxylating)